MDSEESLEELVRSWTLQRPFVGAVAAWNVADVHTTEIPPTLMRTVTNREPYRSHVIADAKLLLNIPFLYGIGTNIEIIKPLVIAPLHDWTQAISPLKAIIHWSLTMSGDNSEGRHFEINRIVFEDDRWKIACMWNDEDRAQTIEFMQFMQRRSSQ